MIHKIAMLLKMDMTMDILNPETSKSRNILLVVYRQKVQQNFDIFTSVAAQIKPNNIFSRVIKYTHQILIPTETIREKRSTAISVSTADTCSCPIIGRRHQTGFENSSLPPGEHSILKSTN